MEQSVEISANLIEAYLKNYEDQKSIHQVVETTSENKGDIGAHYLSASWKQNLKIIRKNGLNEEISIFVKYIPQHEVAKNYILNNGIFGREVKVYNEVLPAFEKLMRENKDFTEPLWPDFLGYKFYEFILLEDLALKGYKNATTETGLRGLDFKHSFIAIKTLAKFHAMSVILVERLELEVYQFRNIHYLKRSERRENRMASKLKCIYKLIKDNMSDKRKKNDYLDKIFEDPMGAILQVSEFDENELNVLNHGDSWTNNFMFKYSPLTKEVIGMRFVDFQVVHYNSYAFDLVYFIHSNVFSDEIDLLLTAYHSSLIETFQFYRHEPKKLPTLDQIKIEVKKKSKFGLVMSLYLLELMQDFSDGSSNSPTLEGLINETGISDNIIKNPKFMEQVIRIVNHYEKINNL